ncbi:MAG TPA: hypothetical protein VEV19_16240 [Ktedonobacteraceae bacterium]|nr:hypothetical protein [Ktedonobacteraceae bacterium]
MLGSHHRERDFALTDDIERRSWFALTKNIISSREAHVGSAAGDELHIVRLKPFEKGVLRQDGFE